jgi:hypothetical protein
MKLIQVTDGPVARYLSTTGLMLVSTGVEALAEILGANAHDPHDQEDALAFIHEVVHHLQTLSSAYMWQSSVACIDAAFDLLAPDRPEERVAAIAEIARRERAWRLRAYGVSVADLCESAAVLESYKGCVKDPSVGEFLQFRDHHFPGKGNSIYRRTFDILADECGAEAAFDLLPVLTLLSLQGDIPGRSFEVFVSHKNVRRADLVGAPAREITEALGMRPPVVATASADDLQRLHPKHRHPTLYPVLVELVRALGDEAFETLARPHKAFAFPVNDAFLPPLVIGAHRQQGAVAIPAGVAKSDQNLRLMVVLQSATVAAARRIVTGVAERVPCPHVACPNHASGLCAGYFVPPPDPETCRFRNEVRNLQGKELHEIAAECAPLVTDEVRRLLASDDPDAVFPEAEAMPLVAARRDRTRAELFDGRHKLDPEDNDGLLMLNCPECGAYWPEWASHRKVRDGFEAKCPTCGKTQEIDSDAIGFTINLDRPSSS